MFEVVERRYQWSANGLAKLVGDQLQSVFKAGASSYALTLQSDAQGISSPSVAGRAITGRPEDESKLVKAESGHPRLARCEPGRPTVVDRARRL